MEMELAGGAEHDILHLSTGLKRAGHQPFVITERGRLCKEVEAEGVPVIYCPIETRSPRRLWANGRRLADIAAEHNIEVLNPQGVYPGLSARWASRRLLKHGRAVPNVVTIHMLGRLTWSYYTLGSHVLNCVADHVIVESHCERRRLQDRGMRRPVTVIYNCFPPERFARDTATREQVRREMGWAGAEVVFVMPARMSPEKRHDLLLEAVARREVKELPLRFYLAGDGPLLEKNQALAQRLGVADRVTFGGFRRDVPKLHKGADVFVLCSRYESLPLSIREAMVASLPVLATDVGGISEAVEDGRSGILVPPNDPQALAEGIVRMASDAERRRLMGRRGHEIYREKFDYDHWIHRTVEVMSQVREQFVEKHS